MTPTEVLAARELFWHNVMREILTSLSVLCSLRPSGQAALPPGRGGEGSDGAGMNSPASEEAGHDQPPRPRFDPTLFDGRLAVLTKGGERIAIADVFPLFACGINTPTERAMSVAVECTVFQIRTPGGHVHTLPLHEIRAFHALTPELMRRLEEIARRRQEAQRGERRLDGQQQPFGFAAFTSLTQSPSRAMEPAPEHPTE